MEKIKVAFFFVAFLVVIGWLGTKEIESKQLYAAIGKLESDSGLCLTAKEIKAIQNAGLTEEYKNYLFEIDYNNPLCYNAAILKK